MRPAFLPIEIIYEFDIFAKCDFVILRNAIIRESLMTQMLLAQFLR